MKDKKSLLYDAKIQAGILAIVAIIFLALVFVAKENMVLMAVWISLCASAFIISCWLLASELHHNASFYNFFLYDEEKKKTVITEKELTFAVVNDRLTRYLSEYVESPLALWSGMPKRLTEKLQEQPAFRTPIAFRMLYEMSLLTPDEILYRFNAAEEWTVSNLCRAIKASGDGVMADMIFSMKRQFNEEQSHIVAFFTKNRRFFEGRIFHYVKRHLNDYVVKK